MKRRRLAIVVLKKEFFPLMSHKKVQNFNTQYHVKIAMFLISVRQRNLLKSEQISIKKSSEEIKILLKMKLQTFHFFVVLLIRVKPRKNGVKFLYFSMKLIVIET